MISTDQWSEPVAARAAMEILHQQWHKAFFVLSRDWIRTEHPLIDVGKSGELAARIILAQAFSRSQLENMQEKEYYDRTETTCDHAGWITIQQFLSSLLAPEVTQWCSHHLADILKGRINCNHFTTMAKDHFDKKPLAVLENCLRRSAALRLGQDHLFDMVIPYLRPTSAKLDDERFDAANMGMVIFQVTNNDCQEYSLANLELLESNEVTGSMSESLKDTTKPDTHHHPADHDSLVSQPTLLIIMHLGSSSERTRLFRAMSVSSDGGRKKDMFELHIEGFGSRSYAGIVEIEHCIQSILDCSKKGKLKEDMAKEIMGDDATEVAWG